MGHKQSFLTLTEKVIWCFGIKRKLDKNPLKRDIGEHFPDFGAIIGIFYVLIIHQSLWFSSMVLCKSGSSNLVTLDNGQILKQLVYERRAA